MRVWTCGKCGKHGHNARTCKNAVEVLSEEPPAPIGPDLQWRPYALRQLLKRGGGECYRCTRPAFAWALCRWHIQIQRQQRSVTEKKRYDWAKQNGICPECYRAPAADDTLICATCREKRRPRLSRWNRSARGKRLKRTSEIKRLAARAEIGLCVRCNEPAVTETLCERHRQEAAMYWREKNGRDLPYPPAQRRLAYNDEKNLEEYANARNYVPIDP